MRVRLHRRRNEDEDSAHKFYTLVTHVDVESFKGIIICLLYNRVINSQCMFLYSGLETKTVDIDDTDD